MSLTTLIQDPEVRERLGPLRPQIRRLLDAPLLVTPRSRRYGLVGTAFDYLIRFEVQRRASATVARHWVAEHAPEMLLGAADGEYDLQVVQDDGPPLFLPPAGGFKKAAKQAERVIGEARNALDDHLLEDPPSESLAGLATHALRLARLDLVHRAGIYDTRLGAVDAEDVEDLLAMLAVAPATLGR